MNDESILIHRVAFAEYFSPPHDAVDGQPIFACTVPPKPPSFELAFVLAFTWRESVRLCRNQERGVVLLLTKPVLRFHKLHDVLQSRFLHHVQLAKRFFVEIPFRGTIVVHSTGRHWSEEIDDGRRGTRFG